MTSRATVALAAGVIVLIIAGVGAIGEYRGWSTAEHQATVQYILAILATVAGAIALWYAIETRHLREASEVQAKHMETQTESLQEELELLREQVRFGFTPVLVSTVLSRKLALMIRGDYLKHGDINVRGGSNRLLEAAADFLGSGHVTSPYRYVSLVENVSDAIALSTITL